MYINLRVKTYNAAARVVTYRPGRHTQDKYSNHPVHVCLRQNISIRITANTDHIIQECNHKIVKWPTII